MARLLGLLALEIQKMAKEKGYNLNVNSLYLNACRLIALMRKKKSKANNKQGWMKTLFFLYQIIRLLND
jgi:hypothetical protein